MESDVIELWSAAIAAIFAAAACSLQLFQFHRELCFVRWWYMDNAESQRAEKKQGRKWRRFHIY